MGISFKTSQQGQALPLGLVMLVAVAATVYFMFNSGQLVQEKIRLTNTADAVAYSGGVYEARVLNYDAYTNRAIIANEIAIGQAVGLSSWAKYMGTSAATIGPYLGLIPYVGPYLESLMSYIETIMDYVTLALSFTVTLHDTAIQALMVSQYAMHARGMRLRLPTEKMSWTKWQERMIRMRGSICCHSRITLPDLPSVTQARTNVFAWGR